MRNFIMHILLAFGTLTILSFGQEVAEKIILAVCIICVCIAGGLAATEGKK